MDKKRLFQRSFQRGSIHLRVIAILSAIIVFALSTSSIAYFIIYNNSFMRQLKETSDSKLNLIKNNLETLTTSVENTSNLFSYDTVVQQRLRSLNLMHAPTSVDLLYTRYLISEVAYAQVKPNTLVDGVGIITLDNRHIDFGAVDTNQIMQLFPQQRIDEITRYQRPIWYGPEYITLSGMQSRPIFFVAKAIISKYNGRSLGISLLYFSEHEVAKILDDSDLDTQEEILLVDGEGNIVVARDNALLKKTAAERYPELTTDKLSALYSVKNGEFTLGGQHHFVNTQYIEKMDWYILSMTPMTHIRVGNTQMVVTLIVIILVCLVLSFLLSYMLMLKYVTRPTYQLLSVMRDIETGDTSIRMEPMGIVELQQLVNGFNHLMDRITQLMDEAVEREKMRRRDRMSLMQAQIQPHFLYNTIQTIVACIRLDQKDQAIETANNLAKFYRISLSRGNDVITMEQEFLLTECYLSILHLRHIEYLTFKIEMAPEIANYRVPKLTLQPLVENAFYHGLSRKLGAADLQVKGYQKGGMVFLEVYDNGVGMPPETVALVLSGEAGHPSKGSFGIKSVDNRLKLLYGPGAGLVIESEQNAFTRVIAQIPVRETDEKGETPC